MTRVTIAGFIYFAIVFAVAFGLGALRVIWIAPALGALTATALEIPIVLAMSWWASARTTSWLAVPPKSADRALMGVVSFAFLMSAEIFLGTVAFGRSLSEQMSGYAQPAGVLGLAGQIAFAIVPWLQARLKL